VRLRTDGLLMRRCWRKDVHAVQGQEMLRAVAAASMVMVWFFFSHGMDDEM